MGDYSEYHRNGLRGPDAIANKIIFTRKYPGKEHLSFLIVEGDIDRTFYKTFVDEDKCEISNADSKSAAIHIVAILAKEAFPGVLAIVDADFDVLEGKSAPNSNVLFTDTHDLETMLIKAPALEKLLAEFGSEEKISQIMQSTGKDIRDILLACSIPIGYLRWVSLREGLALKFEGLDFAQFINKEKLTINPQDLIKTVKNKSQKQHIANEQIKTCQQRIENSANDPWYICCGHDVVSVLSLALRKAIGSWDTNEVKPESLERCLRLAFERSHFYKTQLYASIQQWEQANIPFVILEPE